MTLSSAEGSRQMNVVALGRLIGAKNIENRLASTSAMCQNGKELVV